MRVDSRRVKELFNAALEIPEPADRVAFLDRVCSGDLDLRQHLNALMAAHDRPTRELKRPIAAKPEGARIGNPAQRTAGSGPRGSAAEKTVSFYQDEVTPGSPIGSIIAGRYKLRQEIGEGRMGTVYLAKQTQPVERQVAVKLIKPGIDSKAILAQFESERQAVAFMDHPNIAKIFDSGITPPYEGGAGGGSGERTGGPGASPLFPEGGARGGSGERTGMPIASALPPLTKGGLGGVPGNAQVDFALTTSGGGGSGERTGGPRASPLPPGRPFFVMELVKGIPLMAYCDAHRLGLPERLTLFRQICSAVQHAHQKGIIHRDLKPTNILVESHDEIPVPKVIDFGLARATSGMRLAEHSLVNAFGSVAGSPQYMAPEQASSSALDIDTRADIYALGVILYELLTGSTPIRRETLHNVGLDEMLRLIREVEPEKPSMRLQVGSATADHSPSPGNAVRSSGPYKHRIAAIAAARRTEPALLSRFVRGDLDWIVMKALAKERDRRYESAIAVAQDIERFTNHEPVTAGPATASYRARKFARRHRVGLATAGGFALFLVGATAVSAGLAVWANREWARALSAEVSARVDQVRAQDRQELVRQTLEHWKTDAGLAGIREEKELVKLPVAERTALEQLWNDVDQLLDQRTD